MLTQRKEALTIDDATLYKRCRVQWYGDGIALRDTVPGSVIKTKKQFACRPDDFLVAEIDAKDGGFGIVPPELADAIVSSHYFLFEIDQTQLLPAYLGLFIKTRQFMKQVQAVGSTNYSAVRPYHVLAYTLALPPLIEQARLVAEYNQQAQDARQKRVEAESFHTKSDKYLFSRLGILTTEKPQRRGIWQFIGSGQLSRWDPQFLFGSLKLVFTSPPVKLRQLIARFMADSDGKAIRVDPQSEPDSTFHYLGLENIEKNSGALVALPTIKGEEIKSSCLRIPKGYVAYNKLRPYLNKFWHNNTEFIDVISSPELFVFELAEEINLPYFTAVLSSSVIQHQIRDLMSGARMPRISEADFLNLNFPLPDANVQQDIAAFFAAAKMQAEDLRAQAAALDADARRSFEARIFA